VEQVELSLEDLMVDLNQVHMLAVEQDGWGQAEMVLEEQMVLVEMEEQAAAAVAAVADIHQHQAMVELVELAQFYYTTN
jgi:hypothetical protein